MLTKYPDVAAEWNYKKNDPIRPQDIRFNSSEKYWWICDKGHEWQATAEARCLRKTGCPICSIKRRGMKRVLPKPGRGLIELFPNNAEEWNTEKNNGVTPDTIAAESNKIYWWRCIKGHEWQAKVNSRSSGTGCPFCAGRRKKVE